MFSNILCVKMERDLFANFLNFFTESLFAYAHLINLDSAQYCRQNLLKSITLSLEDGHEIKIFLWFVFAIFGPLVQAHD